jgi:hypothetical protein
LQIWGYVVKLKEKNKRYLEELKTYYDFRSKEDGFPLRSYLIIFLLWHGELSYEYAKLLAKTKMEDRYKEVTFKRAMQQIGSVNNASEILSRLNDHDFIRDKYNNYLLRVTRLRFEHCTDWIFVKEAVKFYLFQYILENNGVYDIEIARDAVGEKFRECEMYNEDYDRLFQYGFTRSMSIILEYNQGRELDKGIQIYV